MHCHIFNFYGNAANLILGMPYKNYCENEMPKKMTVLIEDELDERFRRAIFEVKGLRRGNITEAVEEAIELWIKTRKKEEKT